ncbi:NAD-dependent epimerase/dehydratase family protein [Gammaproteobacteria bacterium]|nr:NAD-dependent epimerase/dehydratase family protein [Gammaproteobacteria bacterium]
MNIALTGSSGLIGSKLLKHLCDLGHEVLSISSSHSSHKDNIFLYEELQSREISFKADFLIHLASINSNLEESEIPLEIELLNKAIDCMENLNCKNFIFFSTIKVYGENSFNANLINVDENFPKAPECSYGLAKELCEQALINLSHEKNFNYLIFRLPPVLINHPKSNIGKLFQLVERGFPIPSFRIGDLNQRSFLNFELLAYVVIEVINEGIISSSKILNIADSEAISTNDLLRRFGKSINKKPRIIYLPNIFFKVMIRINRLQLILCRLFGNFYLSNAKLKKKFNIPEHF